MSTPHRGEFLAACAVALIIVHLLFAQLTIVVGIVCYGVIKVSRWRPLWLAVPAAAGVIWVLAIGPHAAAAGFVDGPGRVAAYLGGVGGHPARLGHLGDAYAGMDGWLPRQAPLALIAGAAEAAFAAWLDWLHTDEWDLPVARPGLIVAARRAAVTWTVLAGGVVTRDGACLGVAASSGRRAALSWREVAGGVLEVGGAGSGAQPAGFQLVHAAIRRRKPVIVVDPGGAGDPASALAGICAAVGAPFYRYSPDGPACYEPLRYGDPAKRAEMLTGMVDWAGTPDHSRRSCIAYLRDVFELIDAAPGDPRVPVLDDVAHLLDPLAMRARMEHVPVYHPRRDILAERVRVSVELVQADPQIVATAAQQIKELRASPVGRWLRPPTGQAEVLLDVGRVVRERAVALFSLGAGGHADAGAQLARLVGQDILAAAAELRDIGVDGDGLVWLRQCGVLPGQLVTELIDRGGDAGLAMLLWAPRAADAVRIHEHVNALVIHRIPDQEAAERLARRTGERLAPTRSVASIPAAAAAPAAAPDGPPPLPAATVGVAAPPAPSRQALVRIPVVPAATLRNLTDDDFVLVVNEPKRRLVPLATALRAPVPAAPTAAPSDAANVAARPVEVAARVRGAANGQGA